MIKGLSADNARPVPPASKRKTDKQESGFADQLMGAKSESSEDLSRNERKNSGRGPMAPKEHEPNREESRSIERDKDSKTSSDLKHDVKNRDDLRSSERRGARREDRSDDERDTRDVRASNYVPSSPHTPVSRFPASPSTDDEAPIVIENPKGSDSQELKLPDFFSKAALEKDGTEIAAKSSVKNGEPAANGRAAFDMSTEVEGLSRQEAMEKFVSEMQSELGIPPEKLLQAFAKLDEKSMQATPEESMGQFLKALDLPAGGEAKAKVLYGDLLKATGDSLASERVAGFASDVNFEVVSPRDAALLTLNDSLEDLNKSFFRKETQDAKKAQHSVDSMDLELGKLMRQPQAKEMSALSSASLLNANNGLVADAAVDAAGTSDDANVTSGRLASVTGLMNSQTGLQTTKAEGSALSDLLSGGGAKIEAEVAKVGSGKSALQSAFAEQMTKALKDDDRKASDAGEVLSEKSALVKTDAQAVLGQDQPVSVVSSRPLMGSADMMINRQATPQDEQDNVKELIKQAQIMVKRGGGEMRMEMKPEGMGAIHLRVNVENGQVNVQMLTENESAKHVLEKGLSELKSNLAQAQLKVQTLSVDVGNDVKNQMDHQATQEQARQHARQMAQDFMGNFRDDQQSLRQGFMDNKGWRQYSRPRKPEAIAPEQVSRVSVASRGDDKKRLNLVA